MGLIRAMVGAAGGALADQWLEFFVQESMGADALVARGQRKTGKRGANRKGEDNVISNGSGIVVNKGQAAMIVDNGRIAEFVAEEGHFTYDQSSEPSVFFGGLGQGVAGLLKSTWERFKFGGIPGKDQRVFFFNTKEIMGNKFGTPSPIPYTVNITSINQRIPVSLRANGTFSYRMTNPMLFFANVSGNVSGDFSRDTDGFDGQLKSEIANSLGPALGRLGGLAYHEISFHTEQLAGILNEVLSDRWRERRGIEIVDFGITCTVPEEDDRRIRQLYDTAIMRDPTMAAATLVSAKSDAMRAAASNTAGAMTGFMGLGMAGAAGGGMDPATLFQMGQANQAAQPPAGGVPSAGSGTWVCSCGHAGNAGKFCAECGSPSPAPAGWVCRCGHAGNTGKFCEECGSPNPASAQWNCPCGHAGNSGRFCAECGAARGGGG